MSQFSHPSISTVGSVSLEARFALFTFRVIIATAAVQRPEDSHEERKHHQQHQQKLDPLDWHQLEPQIYTTIKYPEKWNQLTIFRICLQTTGRRIQLEWLPIDYVNGNEDVIFKNTSITIFIIFLNHSPFCASHMALASIQLFALFKFSCHWLWIILLLWISLIIIGHPCLRIRETNNLWNKLLEKSQQAQRTPKKRIRKYSWLEQLTKLSNYFIKLKLIAINKTIRRMTPELVPCPNLVTLTCQLLDQCHRCKVRFVLNIPGHDRHHRCSAPRTQPRIKKTSPQAPAKGSSTWLTSTRAPDSPKN